MKEYIKTNSTLNKNNINIKVFNSIPTSSGIDSEVIIVKNDGFYQYRNNAWVKILSLVKVSGSGAIGEIKWSIGSPGSNWLLCNGQNIDQNLYPEAYTKIGSKVPDLRATVLFGAGTNTTDNITYHYSITANAILSPKIRVHTHAYVETAHCHRVEDCHTHLYNSRCGGNWKCCCCCYIANPRPRGNVEIPYWSGYALYQCSTTGTVSAPTIVDATSLSNNIYTSETGTYNFGSFPSYGVNYYIRVK